MSKGSRRKHLRECRKRDREKNPKKSKKERRAERRLNKMIEHDIVNYWYKTDNIHYFINEDMPPKVLQQALLFCEHLSLKSTSRWREDDKSHSWVYTNEYGTFPSLRLAGRYRQLRRALNKLLGCPLQDPIQIYTKSCFETKLSVWRFTPKKYIDDLEKLAVKQQKTDEERYEEYLLMHQYDGWEGCI